MIRQKALLALADGTVFWGKSIGAPGVNVGEIIFNTSMTGYQEILTDPSYTEQIVTLTYPHIGNIGINSEDVEAQKIWAKGLVIKSLSPIVSNWREQGNLSDYLQGYQIQGIADIDTRALTRIIRQSGAQSACIMAGDQLDEKLAINHAQAFPGLLGMDLTKVVTTQKVYSWHQGTWQPGQGHKEINTETGTRVVVLDFGIKHNILRLLVDHGCKVTVVPAHFNAQDILKLSPAGVFLSNGPGDPKACHYAIETIRALLETNIPIFGICLGHQLLALASGAQTLKMKFGHHGANHPVQDLANGTVLITSQNHGFAVDQDTLPEHLEITHLSLFDKSVQGIRRKDRLAFGFQGHPEASPGPSDARNLFKTFMQNMIRDQ